METLFRNPVPFADGKAHTNPDPYVLRWCGTYYCYATDADGVKVSSSPDMVHWTRHGYAIQQEGRHDFWAPAVIWRNGTFYMYYSSNPVGEDDGNGEKMQLAVSSSPLGPFIWQKTLFPTFSIDAHPVVWEGEVYLFYSVNNWVGNSPDAPGTCILVDKLVAPDRLEGRPAPVVLPSLPQEIYEKNRFGDGRDWYTIEGACFVPGPQRSFLLYSANCYTDVNYYVGYSWAENKKDLREMEWHKHTLDGEWAPLIRKNEQVEGTGHNTVAFAPDLAGLWMVYHGRDATQAIRPGEEQRQMHIAPLEQGMRGLYMAPPTTDAQPVPAAPGCFARELTLRDCEEVEVCTAPQDLRAEMWLKPRLLHTGARYGIVLRDNGQGDRLEVQFNSGRGSVTVWETLGNLRRRLADARLSADIDPFVPHLLQIDCTDDRWVLRYDETHLLTFSSRVQGGSLRLCAYYSELTVYGLTVTDHAELWGADTALLGERFVCSPAAADEEGLHGNKGTLTLRCARPSDKEEIFTLQADRNAQVTVRTGEESFTLPFRSECVLRCRWEGSSAELRHNGVIVCRWQDLPAGDVEFTVENGVLTSWHCTKICCKPQII